MEDLSVEMVRDYLNDKIIQDLFKKKDNQQYTVENLLLDKMIYAPPSTITIWRWMKRLGYLYTSRTKSFYVDGHAHPAQKQSCREYTKKYPTDWEPRMHRWVQFDKTEVLLQKKEQNIPQEIEGYEYRDENGNDKTEFHVDSCAYLFEYGNKEYQFGGNLSVRMPKGKNPLMIVGQDECTFAQFLLPTKYWGGPKGNRPLLPKPDGQSKMISDFASRELGFGAEITIRKLEEVNELREGKKYADEEAAKEILKTEMKAPLTEAPFVRYFTCGANNEGYWTYNHMVLQLEDGIDCLKIMHPQFDEGQVYKYTKAGERSGMLENDEEENDMM